MPTSQLLPASSCEYMPMAWLYAHPRNSACQGLISQGGEFLVLVAQLSSIFALLGSFWPAYIPHLFLQWKTSPLRPVGRKQNPLRHCGCFLVHMPSLWVFVHLANSPPNPTPLLSQP